MAINNHTNSHVDRTALQVNQVAIISFLVVGFLFNQPWLVAFVALVMVLGTLQPSAALFQQFYHRLLKPNGLLKPNLLQEDAAPHRFAQGLGGAVLVGALVAFGLGAAAVAWGLALLVVALAAVNVLFGFCAGCFVYFQLARLRR